MIVLLRRSWEGVLVESHRRGLGWVAEHAKEWILVSQVEVRFGEGGAVCMLGWGLGAIHSQRTWLGEGGADCWGGWSSG